MFRLSLFLISFTGLFCSGACQPETLWNTPLIEVKSKLKNADYSFIEQMDEEKYRHRSSLQEIFRLGPHAPYYFHFIFEELGKKEQAEKTLLLMVEKALKQPKERLSLWQEESWQLLLGTLLAEKRYAEAEKWALAYLKQPAWSGGSPGPAAAPASPSAYKTKIRRAYLEALYWQEKDTELLAALKTDYPVYTQDPRTLTAAAASQKYEEDPELLLYWAVASCRTEQENWPAAFLELFLNVNLSELHIRTYKFLSNEPARQSRFTPADWDLLTGKYYLAIGERTRGIPLLEKTLPALESGRIAGTKIVKELAFAYLYVDYYTQGIRFFDRLLTRFASFSWPADHPLVRDAREMQGRLYRGKKLYHQAVPLLREVAGITPDNKQRDRCLWFVLDMQLKLSPAQGLKEIRESFTHWHDPAYFTDLLDELIHRLSVKKAWKSMYELKQILTAGAGAGTGRSALPREFRDRLAYLVARYPTSVPHREQPQKQQVRPENNYYALLAAYTRNTWQDFLANSSPLAVAPEAELPQPLAKPTGEPPEHPGPIQSTTLSPDSTQAGQTATGTGRPAPVPTPAPFTEEEAYLSGFFEYGLFNAGFKAATRYAYNIRLSLLLEVAQTLQAGRLYYQAINLGYHYLNRKNAPLTEAEYRLIYPRGYEELIEPLAEEWGLPSWLLYALVWSESAFKISVKSPAGAVGLAQLMPATAREMAQRLKLADPDLTNPAHNLRLGSYYYVRLYERYQSFLKAFMAYNAGPTRVRRWTKEFARYPEELWAEVLPIAETRKYIRKIIHTSVFYAFLYSRRSPAEVIRHFYPALHVSPPASPP